MRVQITIQEKFATAFSVLSFAIVAIPLGIKVSRKETSANLGMGLAMAMAYYFATIVIGWFDTHTALRPDLLMWLPNLVFQGVGLGCFTGSTGADPSGSAVAALTRPVEAKAMPARPSAPPASAATGRR